MIELLEKVNTCLFTILAIGWLPEGLLSIRERWNSICAAFTSVWSRRRTSTPASGETVSDTTVETQSAPALAFITRDGVYCSVSVVDDSPAPKCTEANTTLLD